MNSHKFEQSQSRFGHDRRQHIHNQVYQTNVITTIETKPRILDMIPMATTNVLLATAPILIAPTLGVSPLIIASAAVASTIIAVAPIINEVINHKESQKTINNIPRPTEQILLTNSNILNLIEQKKINMYN